MPAFHAAVVHFGDEVPDTYCGIVSQEHVDAVVAACADHPDRWLKPGPGGAVYVLREDGDLDHYQPVESKFATGGVLPSALGVVRNDSGEPIPVRSAD